MPFNTNNTNNPFGAFATSTGPSVPATPFSGPAPATPYTPATSAGSSGIVVTNPFIPATPSSPTTPSGGTGSMQGGGTTNQQLITRSSQVNNIPWYANPAHGGGIYGPGNMGGLAPGSNTIRTQDPSYTNNGGELITERGGAIPLLQHLNLGLSGMRAAAARGSGVRSPFKQGGGAGGAATDLEKFDNQLLAMGSDYLGKNVAGFAHGGRYNMYNQGGMYDEYNMGGMYDEYNMGGMYKKYNHGGGFYDKAQQMKASIMDQAMQSGIVAAQLDNVRNSNNNNATAKDLVGKMRSFASGGRF